MKTTKIIKNLAALNLVLFISLASIANSNKLHSGDNENTTAKNKVSTVKSTNLDIVSTANSESEFPYLRFDVNKYINGSEISVAPGCSLDYLRFDVINFIGLNETELSEMPSMSDFEYLRFDVNEYLVCNAVNEVPEIEFNYLRFDANRYLSMDSAEIEELPAS